MIREEAAVLRAARLHRCVRRAAALPAASGRPRATAGTIDVVGQQGRARGRAPGTVSDRRNPVVLEQDLPLNFAVAGRAEGDRDVVEEIGPCACRHRGPGQRGGIHGRRRWPSDGEPVARTTGCFRFSEIIWNTARTNMNPTTHTPNRNASAPIPKATAPIANADRCR